jgi:hypothetical protein
MTYICCDEGHPITNLPSLAEYGLIVERWGGYGWTLRETHDPDITDAYVMIGDHGCCAPTRREALMEAYARIANGQYTT